MKRTLSCLVAALFALWPGLTQAAPQFDGDVRHRIKHVFVIVLENEGYNTTFGPASKAPYLSQTLTSQGVLLSQYYGTGHVSLDNYVAMLSGQAATPQTRNDCQVYADFVPSGLTPDGQANWQRLRLSREHQDFARPTRCRRQNLESVHGRYGQRPYARVG